MTNAGDPLITGYSVAPFNMRSTNTCWSSGNKQNCSAILDSPCNRGHAIIMRCSFMHCRHLRSLTPQLAEHDSTSDSLHQTFKAQIVPKCRQKVKDRQRINCTKRKNCATFVQKGARLVVYFITRGDLTTSKSE